MCLTLKKMLLLRIAHRTILLGAQIYSSMTAVKTPFCKLLRDQERNNSIPSYLAA